MKCNQKLCKRNVTSSGNCTICQNAIDKALNEIEASRKKPNFKKIEIDFKLMLETHQKLKQGIRVDPVTLNVLVLGGVLNILCESEAFEQIHEKDPGAGEHHQQGQDGVLGDLGNKAA